MCAEINTRIIVCLLPWTHGFCWGTPAKNTDTARQEQQALYLFHSFYQLPSPLPLSVTFLRWFSSSSPAPSVYFASYGTRRELHTSAERRLFIWCYAIVASPSQSWNEARENRENGTEMIQVYH